MAAIDTSSLFALLFRLPLFLPVAIFFFFLKEVKSSGLESRALDVFCLGLNLHATAF